MNTIETLSSLLLLLIAGHSVALPCHAATYYVAGTGSDTTGDGSSAKPYRSIRKGLQRAVSGDTVIAKSGDYNERVIFPRDGVTLQGQPGAVIRGKGLNSCFSLVLIENRSNVTFSGFEVKDFGNLVDQAAGILVVGSGSHVTVSNNKIHNIRPIFDPKNPLRRTPAVAVYSSGPNNSGLLSHITVSGNEIYDTNARLSEAISFVGNVRFVRITGNRIHHNESGIEILVGGGKGGDYAYFLGGRTDDPKVPVRWIDYSQVDTATISGNEVYANTDPKLGGTGIYVNGAKNITIEGNNVHDNLEGIAANQELTSREDPKRPGKCANSDVMAKGLNVPPGMPARNIIIRNNTVTGNVYRGIRIGNENANGNEGEIYHVQVLKNKVLRNGTNFLFQQNAYDCVVSGNIGIPDQKYATANLPTSRERDKRMAPLEKPSKVTLRPDGVTLLNGKPFFPFGFYVTLDTTEAQCSALETIAAAGFNVVHLDIKHGTSGKDAPLFDRAAALGIHLVVGLPGGEEAKVAALYRNKPALLAWTLCDDANNGSHPVDQVKAIKEAVKQADPDHLTFIPVYDGPMWGEDEGAKNYFDLTDAVGIEIYPITPPSDAKYSGVRHTEDVLAKMAGYAAPYHRPLWSLPQSFPWPGGRIPTPDEARVQTYLSLGHGARGIVAYAFAWDSPEYRGKPYHWNLSENASLWQAYQVLRKEVEALLPALLEGQRTRLDTGNADIVATLWKTKSRSVLTIININEKDSVKVTVPLPKETEGAPRRLFAPSGESLVREEAGLSGALKPLSVHVYELKAIGK